MTHEWTRRKLMNSGLALTVLAGPTAAQPRFPKSPLTWIVPFGPGGLAHTTARVLA